MTIAERPPRTRRAWDIALSAVLLVLAWTATVVGGLFAIFTLAFLDDCPAATCSVGGATSAQVGAGIVAVLLALLGTVGTVLLLVLRRRGWWLALTAWVLVVLIWLAGFALFAVAVNHAAS